MKQIHLKQKELEYIIQLVQQDVEQNNDYTHQDLLSFLEIQAMV